MSDPGHFLGTKSMQPFSNAAASPSPTVLSVRLRVSAVRQLTCDAEGALSSSRLSADVLDHVQRHSDSIMH
jgi:hypothetical protein